LGTQGVAFNVTASDKKVIVILDGEALETTLIHMTHSGRVVVSMIPHRVCHPHPFAKTPHFTIDKRSKNQVPMGCHDLVSIELDSMKLQRFTK
jgi:hypothetical protein